MISAVFSKFLEGGRGWKLTKATEAPKTLAAHEGGVRCVMWCFSEKGKKEGGKSVWCRCDANNSAATPAVATLLALLV